jgi:hypothetical protein
MKITINIFILFFFVSCGSTSENSNVKVSLGLSISDNLSVDSMFHGVEKTTGISIAKKIESSSFEIELPNGDWQFYFTHWDGTQSDVVVECSTINKILSGDDTNLDFEISSHGCGDYNSKSFDATSNQFYKTVISSCSSIPSLNSSPDGSECDANKNSTIKSFKFTLHEYGVVDTLKEVISNNGGIGGCYNSNQDTGSALTISDYINSDSLPLIPASTSLGGNPFAFSLKVFDSTDCSGELIGLKTFRNGLLEKDSRDSVLWAVDEINKRNILYLYDIDGTESLLSPITLPGLVMWLDFSDSTQIFNDVGCSVAASDNQSAKCVYDKSGNANNATEGTSPPVYKENLKNGLSGLSFSGSNLSVPDHPSLDESNGLTVFFVYEETSVVGSVRNLLLKGSSNRTLNLHLGATDKIINFTDDGTSTSKTETAVGHITSQTYILGLQINNSSGQILTKDGALDGSSLDASSSLATVVNTSNDLVIGNQYSGGVDSLQGNIYEVIYFDRTLDATELLLVDSYLKTKWGL